MTKAEIRALMREQRTHAFTPHAAQHVARLAYPLLCGHSVAAYYPMGHELSPLPLLMKLKELNQTLGLPCLSKDHQSLVFRVWQPNDPLKKTTLKFHEPIETAPFMEPSALIVPLLAFDSNLNRLGYGRGDYDRTIHSLKQKRPLLTLGLAYDCQHVPVLPLEPHDEPLDFIVTEKKVYQK